MSYAQMPQIPKYGLTIRHLDNGQTKLESLTRWAVYNQEGTKTHENLIAHSDEDVVLPHQIAVFGYPTKKKKMTREQVREIMREAPDAEEYESHDFVVTDNGGAIDEAHQALFDKLKKCLEENAPKDGHYALDLRFYRHEEEPENELIEPDDIQLAMILAFLNQGNQTH